MLTWTTMIHLGNHIRLTSTEVARFTKITGFVPIDVKTLDDLDAYIRQCKRHYWGISKETRFLHWLMDRERQRCIDGYSGARLRLDMCETGFT